MDRILIQETKTNLCRSLRLIFVSHPVAIGYQELYCCLAKPYKCLRNSKIVLTVIKHGVHSMNLKGRKQFICCERQKQHIA